MSQELKEQAVDVLAVDPLQTEKDMVKNEIVGLGNGMPIEESAAMLFGLYYPKFQILVDQLSNKSLKRLITALIAVPLEDARLNLNNEKERMVYAIAEQLLISKSALILHSYAKHETDKESAKQETNNEEVKGEENNGN